MSLLTELKRRNVHRMAGLYLVAAWLAVQVCSTILPAFDLPTWVLRAVIVALAGETVIDFTFGPPLANVGSVGVIGARLSSEQDSANATTTTAATNKIPLRI